MSYRPGPTDQCSGPVVRSQPGSNNVLQEIDLTLTPIIVSGPFRVGLEFNHDGTPSVATDLDGSIDAAANFILADLGGVSFWFRSSNLGVSGDFIIRSTIDNLVADQTGFWDGTNSKGSKVATGMYFLTIATGGMTTTRTVAVVQ